MTRHPKVSVLLPTYRRPGYLEIALNSAIKQSFDDIEIIVRDNFSQDETESVVRSFSDRRVRYYQATENKGPWINGLELLKLARGDYYITLCDDDLLSENYIECLVSKLESSPSTNLAYGRTVVIDEGGTRRYSRDFETDIHVSGLEILTCWLEGKLPIVSAINFLARSDYYRTLGSDHNFVDGHNCDNAVMLAAGVTGGVLFTNECDFFYRVYSGNTENRTSHYNRARGDLQFVKFLDQRFGKSSRWSTEWKHIRPVLLRRLCRWYFDRRDTLIQKANHGTVLSRMITGLCVPIVYYGFVNSLRTYPRIRTLLDDGDSR